MCVCGNNISYMYLFSVCLSVSLSLVRWQRDLLLHAKRPTNSHILGYKRRCCHGEQRSAATVKRSSSAQESPPSVLLVLCTKVVRS